MTLPIPPYSPSAPQSGRPAPSSPNPTASFPPKPFSYPTFTPLLSSSNPQFGRLSKKLQDLFDSVPDPERLDLSKAAQLHFEILTLYNESHLAGIDVVNFELKLVLEIRQKLRAEGMKVLERGLEGLSQAEVGSGLQVYYNLGELRGTVDGLVSKYKTMMTKSMSVALDIKATSGSGDRGGGFPGPGGVQRSGTPRIGGVRKAKEALWQRMQTCMDQLHSIMVAVWHLQRVLSKKRDSFTHVLLLDEVLNVS